MYGYAELKAELAKPAYTGKTDAQCVVLLNAGTLTTPVSSVSGADIFEACVPAELAALTAEQKALFGNLIGMGEVRVNGTNTRAAFASLFGAGTATRAALLALATRPASWAELYWPNLSAGHVASARSM
jgi:hypothetical protein